MKIIKIVKLLAIVTLFAGCNVLSETETPASNSGNDGERVSQVTVNIGGNARTILPNIGEGFSKYVLSAEPAAGNTAAASVPVEANETWGTIWLSYGDWIITATAYANVDGVDYSAAKGSAPLTVNEDSHWINISVNTPESVGTGTFNYVVRYPSTGTASVKLEPWPLGQAAIFNENASNGTPTDKNVPSGIYFLTVTATASGKTVTRNEIVHIYQQLTTNAEYSFTKLDFGDSTLNLSGTVKVLVNGQQPERAFLMIGTSSSGGSGAVIDFTGTDGSCTWSISYSDSDLELANRLYFNAGLSYNIMKKLLSIPIPIEDTVNIDLGTAEFTTSSLSPNTWVDGEITISEAEDYYSIEVTEGESYFFWFNNGYYSGGDGSKSLNGNFGGFYSNGGYVFDSNNAWDDPVSFTANDSDTVVYIKVRAYGGSDYTGTYAIAYSTNNVRP